jgi:hypothetical protein
LLCLNVTIAAIASTTVSHCHRRHHCHHPPPLPLPPSPLFKEGRMERKTEGRQEGRKAGRKGSWGNFHK